MELPFYTLDVFTSTRLEGNPLAVVVVPAQLKAQLPQATKQKIACEFNLSETVFLHEAADPASTARDIDIFTLDQELVFAGHPTIGTAVLVKRHLAPHVETLNAKAGPLGITSLGGSGGAMRARIPHNVHIHSKVLGDVVGADYPGLSSHPDIRALELKAPVVSVVKGMTFCLVKLPSLEDLARVQLGRLDFTTLPVPLNDDGWNEGLTCRYFYVDLDEAAGPKQEGLRTLRTRMVEMSFEDPATGSAASCLASYLTLSQEKKATRFEVTQGVEMGRKSIISIETSTKDAGNGEVALENLWLGGTAALVMKGTIEVDV